MINAIIALINLIKMLIRFYNRISNLNKKLNEPENELKEENKKEIIKKETKKPKPKKIEPVEKPEIKEIKLPVETKKTSGSFYKGVRNGILISAGLFTSVYLINKFLIPTYHKIPKALPGGLKNFKVKEGLLSYYQDGSGDPIILIHSLNTGSSSHEMEEIYNYYRFKRTVYSIDLLGYGLSQKPDICYTPEMYCEHLNDFINFIKLKHHKQPDVIVLSHSTEYIANIAAKDPKLMNKIIFISPTGLENNITDIKYRINKLALYIFKIPTLGQGLFNLLTCRKNLRYYLETSLFVNPRNLRYSMFQQYYYSTHMNGSKNSPAYRISGELNLENVFNKYLEIKNPSLILRGTGSNLINRYNAIKTIIKENNNIRESIIENGGLLPHIEKTTNFFIVADNFLH